MRKGVGVGIVAVAAVAATLTAPVAGGARQAVDAKWKAAAQQLTMPVFAPAKTFSMTLTRVVPQHPKCGSVKEQLDAYYQSKTAKVHILEGSPLYCKDIPNGDLLAQLTVHKQQAFLLKYCEGAGCPAANSFLVSWAERNVRIIVISRGLTRANVVALATSMRVVPG